MKVKFYLRPKNASFFTLNVSFVLKTAQVLVDNVFDVWTASLRWRMKKSLLPFVSIKWLIYKTRLSKWRTKIKSTSTTGARSLNEVSTNDFLVLTFLFYEASFNRMEKTDKTNGKTKAESPLVTFIIFLKVWSLNVLLFLKFQSTIKFSNICKDPFCENNMIPNNIIWKLTNLILLFFYFVKPRFSLILIGIKVKEKTLNLQFHVQIMPQASKL